MTAAEGEVPARVPTAQASVADVSPVRWLGLLLSLGLFFWSLFLPAYATPLDPGELRGVAATEVFNGGMLLVLGWIAVLGDEPVFAWFANPALAICLWRLAAWKPMTLRGAFVALLCAGLGLTLALSGLNSSHLRPGDDHDLNGISYPLEGACIWVLAFAPALIASLTEFLIALVKAAKAANS